MQVTADDTQGSGKRPKDQKTMLGIDVSKDTLSCTLLDPATRRPLWHKDVRNTCAGYKQLLQHTPPHVAWVLEPTGRYSHGVAKAATEAGRDVRLAQPKKAQLFLRSVQSRAKTDKLDAQGLALYGLSCQLQPFPLKSAMHDHLDQLLAARKGLSQSLCALAARARELPLAAGALTPAVAALQEQLDTVDREIARLTRGAQAAPELGAVQELRKVPGIGPVVAATLVSRLSARSFATSDAFVAFCGLDVRIRQSGKKHGQLGLSKQGEAELRRLLFLAAQASLRAKNSPFKEQYERERQKGLSSTAALCAVARKMARLAWAMVTHGSSYDPQRVYQTPTPPKQHTPQNPHP